MKISIDGYDGTGKTTLAKRIANDYGLIYIYKPNILKIQISENCSYEEAALKAKIIEDRLFKEKDNALISKYYLDALAWVKDYFKNVDAILDRGLLTLYAVSGDDTSKNAFIEFINKGIFFDGSIYLIADDYERVRRIRQNDPNDPDLKHPVKWRNNDLIEFANLLNLNYYALQTDNLGPDEVYEKAKIILNEEFNLKPKKLILK